MTTMLLAVALSASVHLTAPLLLFQETADRESIRQTALDYIEGYYDGNAERMTRALHPNLAKRIVNVDSATGKSRLENMGAERLISMAGSRLAKPTPKDRQQKDVTILDVYGSAAVVKIVANDWIDYLQIAKFDGRWVIVNVLWEMKQK